MRVYHADIIETAARDGTFTATLRGSPITATGADPEHDLCFAMASAGLPDGSIQFWRGATPSLLFRSVHRTAGYRVRLGESYPYRRVKREGAPAVFAKDRGRGVTHNPETLLGGVRLRLALSPVPDARRTVCEAAFAGRCGIAAVGEAAE